MDEETGFLFDVENTLPKPTWANYLCSLMWLFWLLLTDKKAYAHRVQLNNIRDQCTGLVEASRENTRARRAVAARLTAAQHLYASNMDWLRVINRNHATKFQHLAAARGEVFTYTEEDVEGWLTPIEYNVKQDAELLLLSCDSYKKAFDLFVVTGTTLSESLVHCNQAYKNARVAVHFDVLSQLMKEVKTDMDKLADQCTTSVNDFLGKIKDTNTEVLAANKEVDNALKQVDKVAAQSSVSVKRRVLSDMMPNITPAIKKAEKVLVKN
jgi:hypothetical protein